MSRQSAPQLELNRLDGRMVVVTGGTSGLGYHASEQLAALGATVVIAARNPAKAAAAIRSIEAQVPGADVRFRPLDLSSLSSVRIGAEKLATLGRIDVLLANAGVVGLPESAKPPAERGLLPEATGDGHELHWGTNHLGHFALVGLLLPMLLESEGRVVHLGSICHGLPKETADCRPFPQEPHSSYRQYARSKLAVMSFGFELARRLSAAGSGASSLVAHPGTAMDFLDPAREGIISNQPDTPPALVPLLRAIGQGKSEGARPLVAAVAAKVARNGDYWGPSGFWQLRGWPVRVQPRAAALDPEAAARLVALSEELSGVRLPV